MSQTENSTPVTARGWFRYIYALRGDRPAQDEALGRVPGNLKPIVRTMLNCQQDMDRWRRRREVRERVQRD